MMRINIKKFIILILIIVNIGFLYLTRSSLDKRYRELLLENKILDSEIENYGIDENGEREEDIFYKSDEEFILDIEKMLKTNNISDYKIRFIGTVNEDEIIKSEVLIDCNSNIVDIRKLLKNIDNHNKINSKSISIVSNGGIINSNIILYIESDFKNRFRSERDLINVNPFKIKNREVVLSIEKENLDNKDVKDKENIIKEDKEKSNIDRELREVVSNSSKNIIVKNEIGNIEFRDEEYYIYEELDKNMKVFSFYTKNNNSEKIFIGEKIVVDHIEGPLLIDFNLNSTIKNLYVGLEIHLNGGKLYRDELFHYKSNSWEYFNLILEDESIDSIRMFLLNKNVKKGSILIDNFNIRGIEHEEI